jgi:GSH-dependent disulfide-bond oxidoreductase
MADLSQFMITQRWPAQHPDRIQLYSLATPNGVKVSIALEELGLPYEVHKVAFATDEQLTPEFRSLNPYGKIPAIIDPDGPGGKPLPLAESGAILLYLADKTGRLMPSDPHERWQCVQWLMFQMGGVGPMFGQLGHFFKFAADKVKDPYPTQRYVGESKRILGVLEERLDGRAHVMGAEFTIADIAIAPWVRNLVGFYGAGEIVGFDGYPRVKDYLARVLARPSVERGLKIPA